jgi:hypothetical protein
MNERMLMLMMLMLMLMMLMMKGRAGETRARRGVAGNKHERAAASTSIIMMPVLSKIYVCTLCNI